MTVRIQKAPHSIRNKHSAHRESIQSKVNTKQAKIWQEKKQ